MRRRLSFEALEDRQLLAVLTVNSLLDNTPSADGLVTLREAIAAANANTLTDLGQTGSGADTIQFAAGLSGAVDLSTSGDSGVGPSALLVTSTITIRGNANGITIARAASADMRLFRVTASGNLTLESINVTGGVARGAIGAPGENGGEGRGGAVFNEGVLQIVASTLYDNQSIGGIAGVGGSSGVGLGGAIYNADATLIVRNATLSGNKALNSAENAAHSAFGGGIYGYNGSLQVSNSTITNSTAASGRGIYLLAVGDEATAVLQSVIIAQSDASVFDLFASFEAGGTVNVSGTNNLIRKLNDFEEIALPEFITPELGDPLLAPLASNGGPTLTHAMPVNSPAFDRGNNVLNLVNDQRGSTFTREVGAAVDIGAFELQSTAQELPGDYNRDEVVDAADYVVWRKTIGSGVDTFEGADGDGSGFVDPGDYVVWTKNFGRDMPAGLGGSQFFDGPVSTIISIDEKPGLLLPYVFAAFASDDEDAAKHESPPLPPELRPIMDDAYDKALLAVLLDWAPGQRRPRLS